MAEALHQQKPILIIVHKQSCPICQRVKPKFAIHRGVRYLSRYFAMVNLEPDEVPDEENFEPDGRYVPRFMFYNSNGIILKEIQSSDPQFKYFYEDFDVLEENMKRVLSNTNTIV